MQEERFLELQYQTLRKEIEETKSRIFKIMIGGTISIPSFQLLVHLLSKEPDTKYDVEIIMIFTPILVIIITLLFLAEQNFMMRAGHFIRHHIEDRYKKQSFERRMPDYKGWETWLATSDDYDPRSAESCLNISFIMLAVFYYFISMCLAAHYARDYHDLSFIKYIPYIRYHLSGFVFIVYLLLGLWVSRKFYKKGFTTSLTGKELKK